MVANPGLCKPDSAEERKDVVARLRRLGLFYCAGVASEFYTVSGRWWNDLMEQSFHADLNAYRLAAAQYGFRRGLCFSLLRQTRDLVDDNRGAVVAVAQPLCASCRLGGAEIRRLVAEAPPMRNTSRLRAPGEYRIPIGGR